MSIANEIKNSGLKATGPRMKILEVFQNAQERHMSAEDVYRILIQQIRKFNENIPPLINAYMNLSPTMRVFDTVSNPDFGGVEETGILVTIRDIYPEKRLRYTRWLGWRANLKHRREEFSERLREHFERIKKKRNA